MARNATLLRRFFRLAPVRIVAGVAFLFLAVVLRDILLSLFRTAVPIQDPPAVWLGPAGPAPVTWAGALYSLLAAVLTVGLGYGAYRLFTRLLERRTPAELAHARALPELTAGAAIGLGLVSVLVFALWLAGAYGVTAVKGWFFLLAPAAGSATAAFMEELAFRGILFRIVEERWGTWLALGLTAALFGLAHGTNPGATVWSVTAIVLTAGVVLGAAYALTRRLWLPIGLHFAVNFAQEGLFGLPVSGKAGHGLVEGSLSGPELLTGGQFGIEASVLLIPLGVLLGGALLWQARKRDRIRLPFWARKVPESAAVQPPTGS